MSMNIDIEINFAQDYSPKKILELLLKNIDGRLDLYYLSAKNYRLVK